MSEKIVFIIKIDRDNEVIAYTLDELNKMLDDLEKGFLFSVREHILINRISKEEYITYRNELGFMMKGEVKNYNLKEDLLEYLIRLNFLNKSREDEERGKFYPFYTRIIKVEKYFLDDIFFRLEVSIEIQNPHRDVDV